MWKYQHQIHDCPQAKEQPRLALQSRVYAIIAQDVETTLDVIRDAIKNKYLSSELMTFLNNYRVHNSSLKLICIWGIIS